MEECCKLQSAPTVNEQADPCQADKTLYRRFQAVTRNSTTGTDPDRFAVASRKTCRQGSRFEYYELMKRTSLEFPMISEPTKESTKESVSTALNVPQRYGLLKSLTGDSENVRIKVYPIKVGVGDPPSICRKSEAMDRVLPWSLGTLCSVFASHPFQRRVIE